ncbi:hypothetical protein DH2020_045495 [Rehmannia glutinosa]|uniref:F-box/kelch-repeat protein n=1 Tax=Rehmannia glutinosa TaxID=99300 RepID=A0ABR0UE62_REHGL
MNAAKKLCKDKETINENERRNQQTESILLPGLPNHLAQLCLSTLQPSLLYKVCKSWQHLIYSPDFPPYLSLYTIVSQTPPVSSSLNHVQGQCQSPSVNFFCFDPISSKWRSLPTPPFDPSLCLLRRHPSYISRILPIQSITASRKLVLISASTEKFFPALTRPLVFDPLSSKWNFGPPLSAPRRWCVTGSIHGIIYVASGTGAKYNSDVARSIERWDMTKKEIEWSWEKGEPFRDGRFSREAIEAVGYRGKLCMVNIKGKAVKEGAVYDVVMDQWEEMPRGMLGGWNGPTTIDDGDGVMYMVDQESGSLSKYDGENDRWDEIIENLEYLKGAEHISAGRGKICVVSADGRKIVVVDVFARPSKVWILDPPRGMEVIAVHVLPRMSHPESEQFSD